MYVVLAGSDCSGKSSIIHKLNIPNFTIIKEPYFPENIELLKEHHDVNEIISIFARDRSALFKILPPNINIISDRSVICNYVYQSLQLHIPVAEAISYIKSFQSSRIPKIDHIFYIHASAETLTRRCNKRREPMTILRANAIMQRYLTTFNILNIPYTSLNTDQLSIDDCIDEITTYIINHQ